MKKKFGKSATILCFLELKKAYHEIFFRDKRNWWDDKKRVSGSSVENWAI